MVLGKLPVPGRPTIWITVGQGPTALAVGAGGGCLDIFILIYPFFPLTPSLWETARYRLKYCLKGPLNPKQPTNQPSNPIRNYQILPINIPKSPISHIYVCIVQTKLPGRVAQSVGHLTRKSGVLGSILGLATYFRFSFRFFKKGSWGWSGGAKVLG